MCKNNTISLLGLAVGLLSFAFTTGLGAQELVPENSEGKLGEAKQSKQDASRKEQATIDEIIVTGQGSYYDKNASSATRLDLPIIETPQSVFIINDDLMADQQAFRFDQILQNDSSVQKANNFLGAYSSYKVRGFDISNTSNYLRDGRIFYHLASPPVEVLERVEVLKGPSSVLYGAMKPGGLINMIPKRPLAEYETSLKATFGTNSLRHFHLDHGGPATSSGNLRYRVNLVNESVNSFRKFVDGSDFNTKRNALAAALDWDINEKALLRFNFDITQDKRPQDIGTVNLSGDFSNKNNELIISQPWTKYDSDVWNFNTEFNYQITDAINLRTGISLQNFERDRYDNQIRGLPDASGNILVRARRRVNRRDYTTYFADINLRFSTGMLEHKLLLGIEQVDVDINSNETQRNVNFISNIFNPVIIPDPLITTRKEKNLGTEERQGVYIHDVISVGDYWRFLLGARYSRYDAEFKNSAGRVTARQEATHTTPRVGVLYLPNRNLSLYGSFSQSFEPNSPVAPTFTNAGEVLDPTLGEQIELGAKWELLEGRLFSTFALFTIDRKNAPYNNVQANTMEQRGEQTHKGGELSMAGLVGENISITGSATYLSAEFTESDKQNLIGNTPAGVPKLALSLSAEYAFLGGIANGLSIQGGRFYEGKRPIDDANTYDLDAYHRFDAGLKYLIPHDSQSDKEWIIRLTAQNLADKKYYKGSSPLSVNPERPRQIRASLEFKF